MILQVDGIASHIQMVGSSGPHLLLLHGWGPASVSLEGHLLPLARSLGGRFRVLAADFPGHGLSGAPTGVWGVPEFAAWTLKVMDQMGVSRTSIVAHSFGGRVALWLAANHPSRVQRLVLTGCAGIRPRRSLEARVRSFLFKAGRAGLRILSMVPPMREKSKSWLGGLRAEFSSADYLATPEALRGCFSRIVRQDLRPLLEKIDQPVLLVWGERDTATPLWMGEAMQRTIPDARMLVYQADDHWAYRNQLARFTTAVDVFVGEGRG